MNRKLLISYPGNEALGEKLLAQEHFEKADFVLRSFPDGETYFRLLSDVRDKTVSILCSLNNPNEKGLSLFFIAQTARELGASSVELIAPYLAYMRQDEAFHPGESVTAKHFGTFLLACFDRLITVDPHLHRIHNIHDVFPLQTEVLHSTTLIAKWAAQHEPDSFLIGPDGESKQWIEAVAKEAGCPYIVATKERLGDRNVRLTLPDLGKYKSMTPVIIDDIISTGHTMIEVIQQLQLAGMRSPVCIGIHALFAGNTYEEMFKAGAGKVITTNTIAHPSNGIDISSLF